MAFPVATSALQRSASVGAELCALNSRFRHRSSGHAADSIGHRAVGAESTYWFAELGPLPRLGCCYRDVSANGLRLLVVALS